MTDREQPREREGLGVFVAISLGLGFVWGLIFLALAVSGAPPIAWIVTGALWVLTCVGLVRTIRRYNCPR